MVDHSLPTIKSTNEASRNRVAIENPVGVFIGGTSGIGEHTAYKFAQYTKSPTVYIVGRNEIAGKSILDRLKEINKDPQSRFYFMKHDVTYVKECDQLCKDIAANEKKVNLLFLSTGFLNIGGRNENAEGIDLKMGVNYYGRWRIAEKLMPLLETARASGEQARVVTVLAAGTEAKVNENDLGLKDTYNMLNVNRHFVTFNSLAVKRFARIYPDIAFVHAHPGLVKTQILRDLPIWIRVPSMLFMPFATSQEDSAEKFFYMGYGGEEFAKGAHFVKASLDEVTPKEEYTSEQLQEKVWQHTEQVFEDALKRDTPPQ
ncbi:hypothetical protein TRVA0_011S00650 [Trichomonascus vanleenenianus]|uniref:uncharacterized protein n=1 Tax=Trichomonascus vanleenenianus TaxID=2268995 RepID=UPI003ECA0644